MIDAKEQHHVQISAIVEGAITAIKEHPRVGRGVPIIVAIEACSSDATWLAPLFFEHDDVIVLSEFQHEGRFGVPKNPSVLIGLVGATEAFLTRNLVHIPADAVAFSTRFTKTQSTMHAVRENLWRQFANFRINHATGKTSGKGGGENDDLIIAFMMALYWMTKFSVKNDENYNRFKARYPNRTWLAALQPMLSSSAAAALGPAVSAPYDD